MGRCSALVCLLAIGCAHGSFSNGIYRKGALGYRVGPLPAPWRQVHGDANVQFYNDRTTSVIMANADCGERTLNSSPLRVLGNTLLFGFTEQKIRSQEVVPFAGREAERRVVDAKLDGVPVVVESWVLKKDQCVYDLDLVSPPDHYALDRSAFVKFVHGFATLPV